MLKSFEATIGTDGVVHPTEDVRLPRECRVIVTILDDAPAAFEPALLSESALAEDWNRPEEDAAWSHLQQALQH